MPESLAMHMFCLTLVEVSCILPRLRMCWGFGMLWFEVLLAASSSWSAGAQKVHRWACAAVVLFGQVACNGAPSAVTNSWRGGPAASALAQRTSRRWPVFLVSVITG
jgi:hypothetical protein